MPITSLSARRVFIAPALIALMLAPAAYAADARPSTAGANTTPAALYHNYCSVCHGDRGDGRSRATNSLSTRPRDFTSDASRRDLTRERLISAIATGVPGTAMAGWKSQLSAQEIERLADYVLATFVRASADPRVARGRTIYAASCSVCHGDRGQGAMWAGANMTAPPRDFRSPQAVAELTRERMIASVTNGRPGTTMSAFGSQLSREEIDAVVEFIRTSLMLPATEGISGKHAYGARETKPAATAPVVASDMTLPLPVKRTADVARGKVFYDANCATCHGTKGDGQGPRAYFINPKPRNLLDEAARRTFNRPALYAAIAEGKLGTEMPGWKQVLSEQEMANVTEYVFREFIRKGEAARPAQAAGK